MDPEIIPSTSESSSSSRTHSGRNPEKRPLVEEPFDLDHLEIPGVDLDALNGFSFLEEFKETSPVVSTSPTMSPRSLNERAAFVEEVNDRGRRLFGSIPAFNYPSSYASRPVNWAKLNKSIAFGRGYRGRSPVIHEKVWMMPEYGMHGIPLIWFEYGFHLPMHPFFQSVYEKIGCGLSQFSPNSFIQISGFIARCCEMEIEPTLRLFFTIYNVKYTEKLVYFSTRAGRKKLVHCKSSNSGFHPNWIYLYGPDLEFIRPFSDLSADHLKYLNNMRQEDDESFLMSFHRCDPIYQFGEFDDEDFLTRHNLAGDSLTLVLSKGLVPEMDKAFKVLARRGRAARSNVASNAPSVPGGSINRLAVLEGLPDDVHPLDTGSNEVEVVSGVKRRANDGAGEGGRRVVLHRSNATAPINLPAGPSSVPPAEDVVIPPAPLRTVPMGSLKVEIMPEQGWCSGNQPPLHAFDVLRLPQDDDSYSRKSRVEVAQRLKSRAGRFVSDVSRVVAAYEADTEVITKMMKDLDIARNVAAGADEKVRDVRDQYRQLEKEKSRVERDLGALKEGHVSEVRLLKQKIWDLEKDYSALQEMQLSTESENRRLKEASLKLTDRVAELQEEVEKGVNDIVEAVGKGYDSCHDRLVAARYDLSGHSFEDYCYDLSRSRDPEGPPVPDSSEPNLPVNPDKDSIGVEHAATLNEPSLVQVEESRTASEDVVNAVAETLQATSFREVTGDVEKAGNAS